MSESLETMARLAMLRKRPCSTTPTMARMELARGLWVEDFSAGTIEDQVAFVGDVVAAFGLLPDVRVNAHGGEFCGHERGAAMVMTSTGRGKFAEVLDDFAGIGDHDKFFGGAGYDFFAEEGAAATFDEGQAGRNFVGAIDGDVDYGSLVKIDQGDGERLPRGVRCHWTW